jgi:hypothetical protein
MALGVAVARPASRGKQERQRADDAPTALPLSDTSGHDIVALMPPRGRKRVSTDEVLEKLGAPAQDVVEQLRLSANTAYDDASDRAESAERRAATIQGAIAIAASLVVAGGSLLLGTSAPAGSWRTPIAIGFGLAVTLLAIAAWRAFLVTWPRFMWATPSANDTFEHAKAATAHTIQLERVADLLVACGRNDSIARLKLALLGQAMQWLMAALALLAALPDPSCISLRASLPARRNNLDKLRSWIADRAYHDPIGRLGLRVWDVTPDEAPAPYLPEGKPAGPPAHWSVTATFEVF